MAVSREDLEILEEHFDERYVRKSECNEKQNVVNSRFANDDKRIDLLLQNQKINNWLTTAIAGGIIALVINVFMGG